MIENPYYILAGKGHGPYELHDIGDLDLEKAAMASEVGLSRSAFVERFTSLVSIPPIRYKVGGCRPRKLNLRETSRTIAQLAHSVGYESEEAFSLAFKRILFPWVSHIMISRVAKPRSASRPGSTGRFSADRPQTRSLGRLFPNRGGSMFQAAEYSAVEILRNGQRLLIRALKPEDRDDLIAAVGGLTAQSLRRRFFGAKHNLTEAELGFFINVDFIGQVALVAVAEEAGRPVIVGGARYIIVEPGRAEIAFTVADKYQGTGIAAALLHHLAAIARESGLTELIADVLPENIAMLRVFERSGLPHREEREPGAIHIALQVTNPEDSYGHN